MKEAIVTSSLEVKIVDSPIPEPGPEQVVIQVVVSGSNPKDWYVHVLSLLYHPNISIHDSNRLDLKSIVTCTTNISLLPFQFPVPRNPLHKNTTKSSLTTPQENPRLLQERPKHRR